MVANDTKMVTKAARLATNLLAKNDSNLALPPRFRQVLIESPLQPWYRRRHAIQRGRCMLTMSRLKCPPVGAVWKSGEVSLRKDEVRCRFIERRDSLTKNEATKQDIESKSHR
ncbi:hypothetical protein TNCV_4448311 [Trichonephila clavipes]|nr:hypothetical protein TNCV_4448311 [Trichonephila clavipes]